MSTDRGTQVQRDAPEWEHLQRTSIYVIHPDGQGLRRITNGERYAGSPRWSPDGKRIVFYEMNVTDTHKARGGRQAQIESQIVSVDVTTGARQEHASALGLKVSPQCLSNDRVGYVLKGGTEPGIRYSSGPRGVRAKFAILRGLAIAAASCTTAAVAQIDVRTNHCSRSSVD